MPEDGQETVGLPLAELLKSLEGKMPKTPRAELFKDMFASLEDGTKIPVHEAERIFKICLKEETNFTLSAKLIKFLLSNEKALETISKSTLESSASYLFRYMNNVCKTDMSLKHVKRLMLHTFLLLPNEIVSEYMIQHPDIVSLFDLDAQNILKMCQLLKILQLMSQEDALTFVKHNIAYWFDVFIPKVMGNLVEMSLNESNSIVVIEAFEILTQQLMQIDYFETPSWNIFLQNVSNVQKYPLIVKSLLEVRSNIWHRLWVVLTKLLKNYIITPGKLGTPINSLLPVLEAAFKMESKQRCRAFDCWKHIIDNFCIETKDNCLRKRFKLLLVPFKLNNAKTEDIAIVKLNTWWYCILKFESHVENFSNDLLISFLHYMFGRYSGTKAVFSAAELSNTLKKQCLEIFAEIVGHCNCECKSNVPKLNNKILSLKLLVNDWNDWLHSLKICLKLTSAVYDNDTKSIIRCIWKSLLLLISELPENAVREDLFTDVLNLLSPGQNVLPNPFIILTLIESLFEDDKVQELLKSKNEDYMPFCKIITIVTNTYVDNYVNSNKTEEIMNIFKLIAASLLKEIFRNMFDIDVYLSRLSSNDSSLQLWTAIMEAMCEIDDDIETEILFALLKWPLKCDINKFNDVKHSAIVWYTIYNLMYQHIKDTVFDKNVMEYIILSNDGNNQVKYFNTCITIAILKQRLLNDKYPCNLVDILQKSTQNIANYKDYDQVVPLLVDTLGVLLNKAENTVNVDTTTTAMICTKQVIDLIVLGITENSEDKQAVDTLLTLFRNLLKPIGPLFQIHKYNNSVLIVIDCLIEHKHNCSKKSPLFRAINLALRTFLLNTVNNDVKNKILTELEMPQVKRETIDVQNNFKVFSAPKIIKIKKKKKDEPNIVSKVVENGEEYVVVKSNWKFNPRNLTENQKEKFQRKREDIPALYQDLSQSQDEFKLTKWKIDSQDTSVSSNSKSVSNDKSVVVLNKLPTDVVPNIMENILHDTDKKEASQSNSTQPPITIKKSVTPVTPKNTKSPRMALKDRVFRNMKNLLEKSTPPKDLEVSHNIQVQMLAENEPTTPKSKSTNNLNSDRPSRMRKTPKKFVDSELFASKKRQSNSQNCPSDRNSANVVNITDVLSVHESDSKGSEDKIKDDSEGKDKIMVSVTVEEIKSEIPVNGCNLYEQSNNDNLTTSINDGITKINEINKDDITSLDVTKAKAMDVIPLEAEEVQNVIDDGLNKSKESVSLGPKAVSKELEEHVNNENISLQRGLELPVTPALGDKTEEIREEEKKDEEKRAKSSTKKRDRKSRLEKELMIDMVDCLYLKKQSEKRITRRKLTDPIETSELKCEKVNKSKTDALATPKRPRFTKKNKKQQVCPISEPKSVTVCESQDKANSQDLCSEDVIESSQDSTLSVMNSVKSTIVQPVIKIKKLKLPTKNQNLSPLQKSDIIESDKTICQYSKDDIELPQNKTVEELKNITADLTEVMDTQPVGDTDDGTLINEFLPMTIYLPSTISSETQEIAEADTQPNSEDMEFETPQTKDHIMNQTLEKANEETSKNIHESSNEIDNKTNYANDDEKQAGVSSPFKDQHQRKQEFLNNTLEISPIKIQSPDRDKKSPSPETSDYDYIVIQLSSPVQSNGEPFDKNWSPEFFTDDKTSPDKRDSSPTRSEISSNNNSSPSSSLSLKKNRPAVRSGGRAAQMLGLCVPEKLCTINMEKAETEETKKTSINSPARRNLRILYNSVAESNNENNEYEENNSFLKFKRSLPAVDSSPSGPILKRKLADIADEATASPASKRKRVSFHDPPVSTTISVHKYIEPNGPRSPQNSAQKRLERQNRHTPYSKSPKKLENTFKLVSVLAKTAESFSDGEQSLTADDTLSLDVTPAIEVVKTSELNDTDPICPDLLACSDPIDVIASELSSSTMKDLLVKELEGKINTVGDLAKMTELEVNRLCIKAPKVQTAKKVLSDYARKKVEKIHDETSVIEGDIIEAECRSLDFEMQTDRITCSDIEVQVVPDPGSVNSTQTDIACTEHTSTQTDESGSRSTTDIIQSCISEKQDFVEKLSEHLEDDSIKKIASKLSTSALIELLMNKCGKSNSTLLNLILQDESSDKTNSSKSGQQISIIKDYIMDNFDSNEISLLCGKLLIKAYDKPT